jgi:L-threonylcarbamoyladenylate synthase
VITAQAAIPCIVATAAQRLASGDLVAFPTETVYGLGADGLNPKAVARIFSVKGRPADHPLILHVGNVAAAKNLAADWPLAAEQLSAAFWPGPLTLILKRAAQVPDAVTGGQDTVGVRIPAHPVAQALLNEFEKMGSGVIAAPSANRFGAISPTRAKDVIGSLGDRLGPNDLVLDGGDCAVGVESTIVDCSGAVPRILRPGGISRSLIDQVLMSDQGQGAAMRVSAESAESMAANASSGLAESNASVNVTRPISGEQTPRVSGSLALHYAPRTPLRVLPATAISAEIDRCLAQHPDARVAALLLHAADYPNTLVRQARTDPAAYAHDLYAALNDLDAHGFDLLIVESPPHGPEWEAVHDRLARASAGCLNRRFRKTRGCFSGSGRSV